MARPTRPRLAKPLWIAATALTRGLPLVACDRDFGPVEGLELIYLPRKPDSRPLAR
jgi:predicted nucleic acid-binding protein